MATPKKTSAALRKFGLVMTVPLGILGGLLLWRARDAAGGFTPATYVILAAAGFFGVTGLLMPRVLQPIEWAWMKLAVALSFIMTRVILTLTYFLMVTPIGIVMRLAGRDPIELRLNPQASTYWSPVEEGGPATRPRAPF